MDETKLLWDERGSHKPAPRSSPTANWLVLLSQNLSYKSYFSRGWTGMIPFFRVFCFGVFLKGEKSCFLVCTVINIYPFQSLQDRLTCLICNSNRGYNHSSQVAPWWNMFLLQLLLTRNVSASNFPTFSERTSSCFWTQSLKHVSDSAQRPGSLGLGFRETEYLSGIWKLWC